MEHTCSLRFEGNHQRALSLAETSLTTLGFRFTQRSPEKLEAEGPGLNSTRQNPIMGASRIEIVARQNQMNLRAELGGARTMVRFVTIFPVALCLGLGLILSTVFFFAFGPGWPIASVALTCAAIAVVWVFLGQWMAKGIEHRTRESLDALLANMAAAAKS